MKFINSLVSDIYQQVEKKDGWFNPELARSLSDDIAVRLASQLGQEVRKPTLRMSQMGPKCPRALWHSIHTPELAEALPPWAEIKYSFGHILEALAVTLAKAAGHEVVGEQDELHLDGITGHRDCVIDGCVVDVKSCSQPAFRKLKEKTLANDDSFGYLEQLDCYTVASLDDPLVRVKDKAYILGIDKVLGHMVLFQHEIRFNHIKQRIAKYKEIVARDTAPACECGTVSIGESGNIALDTRASYNLFKYCCKPNLRTFLYARGPQYLTHVERVPDVPEIDRQGRLCT